MEYIPSDEIRGVISHLILAYLAKKWAEMVTSLATFYAECTKHLQRSPGHVVRNSRVARYHFFVCLFTQPLDSLPLHLVTVEKAEYNILK